MGAVRWLELEERVHIDGAFLVEVSMQLGPVAAQELLNEALGAIAVELRMLADFTEALPEAVSRSPELADAGRAEFGQTDVGLADMVQSCDRLSRMAWELGLTTLSGVAVDLGLCAEAGQMIHFRAVEARLQRVGRGSLSAAWREAASG